MLKWRIFQNIKHNTFLSNYTFLEKSFIISFTLHCIILLILYSYIAIVINTLSPSPWLIGLSYIFHFICGIVTVCYFFFSHFNICIFLNMRRINFLKNYFYRFNNNQYCMASYFVLLISVLLF